MNDKALTYVAKSWAEAQDILAGLRCIAGCKAPYLLTADAHDTEFSYYVFPGIRCNKQLLAELSEFARGIAWGRRL
ncbi:MAG: hypothetical protein WC742_15455 [Gallionellaceae bacterium]|jgi:hypothetical protein